MPLQAGHADALMKMLSKYGPVTLSVSMSIRYSEPPSSPTEVVVNTEIEEGIPVRAIVILLTGASDRLARADDMDFATWVDVVESLRGNARNWIICVRHERVRRADLGNLSTSVALRRRNKGRRTRLSMRSAKAWLPPLGVPKVVVVIWMLESRRMLSMSASKDEMAAPARQSEY